MPAPIIDLSGGLGFGGASVPSGWADDGTVIRLTTTTDQEGIGTASPDASASLEISSTARGILLPRMTTAQRTAVASPAVGLLVYDTDLNQWMGYNGSWVILG